MCIRDRVNILENLAQYLVRKKELFLGKNKVWAESIEVMVDKKLTPEVKIIMLSPIVMYSTLYRHDGKKKTYYYNPVSYTHLDVYKRQG